MTTNIQIAYQVTAVGMVAPATLQSRLAAVALPAGPTGGIPQMASVTLVNDTTTLSGSVATRTINFAPGANFAKQFPSTAAAAGAFTNLYTAILANALSTTVTPLAPVLT